MLVRYHEFVMAPRLRVSAMKSRTLKLQLVTGAGATYEMTALDPWLPGHTCQLRPPIVVVPTTEPMGWMFPWRLNQIMISWRFTPSRRGVGSSQMSYAAS